MRRCCLFNFANICFTMTICLISVLGQDEEVHDIHDSHKFNLHIVNFSIPTEGKGLGAMEAKIVGGTPVPIERYPYAVVLHNAGGLCAGTILNSYAVLTAAHCFQENEDVYDMTIHVGARDRYDEHAEVYDVRKLVMHPDYNKPMPFAHDIAMMFVFKKIQFGKRVQRAILVNSDAWMNEKEKDFTVTGWGMIKYNGPLSDMGLLMAKLQYFDRHKCGKMHSLTLTPDMFCLYGDAQRDTCKGDSGGGVMWKGLLVGIVSHGDGCAGMNKPSVYSNVWYFRSWIQSTIHDFLRDHCGLRSSLTNKQSHYKYRIWKDRFSRAMEAKIVGGTGANIEEFPFAVMLLEDDRYICSGTIINTWSVMTAAHCFGEPTQQTNTSSFKIVAGETRIVEQWKSKSVYNVSLITIHKNFEYEMKRNDIAMVFVNRPFEFSRKLKKGLLINHIEWMNEDMKNFTVIGWGSTKEGNLVASELLLKAQMKYWSHEHCGLDKEIEKDMFCLNGEGERDTCVGDSGAGVVWNGFIVGVVSYGEGPCAGINSTSVYANVFYYRSWLRKTIRKFIKFYCNNTVLFVSELKKKKLLPNLVILEDH